jgi:hypothetical protein
MTIRKISFLSLILLLLTCSAFAQDLPTVEVTLSQDSARRGDVVTANVFIRTDLEIIGADVEITVDDTCLQIEGREMGDYFPPGDGESVTIFEETTANSTRLAMNVLNFDHIPTSDGLYFSVPLRVVCDEADAAVDIAIAHLVQRGIIDHKAADGQVNLVNATLAISPTAAVVASPEVTDEVVSTVDSADAGVQVDTTTDEDTSDNTVLIIAIGGMIVAGIGLILLFIFYRRSKRKKE